MDWHISRGLLASITHDALAAPGMERCGLLLGQGGWILDHRPAENIAADPARHFELDGRVLVAAERAARHGGLPVIGHYHSHPNGLEQPSRTDADAAGDDGRLWLIVTKAGVSAWHDVRAGSLYGAFEPVTLIVCADDAQPLASPGTAP